LGWADGPEHYSSNDGGAIRCPVYKYYNGAKGGFAYAALYEQSGAVNIGMIIFNIE
jgi:hypothetical protein